MQRDCAFEKDVLHLGNLRIGKTTLDRTHSLTSLVVEETHALGAEVGVDHVDIVALADGLVRALGLACTAVDAIAGDVGRHMRASMGRPMRCVKGSVAAALSRRGWGPLRFPQTPFARLVATLLTYAGLLGKLCFPAGGHPHMTQQRD